MIKANYSTCRRGFLRVGLASLAGAATAAVVPGASAMAMIRPSGLRGLQFHNTHTDENLDVTYWRNGSYDRSAWGKINHILRDHYSGDVFPMDLRLMDLLYDLQNRVGYNGRIEIISGYRSPRTNMRLAQCSDGVARKSYHTKGMAIDIRMPGAGLHHIYETAIGMHRGGAGFYPDSQFVHVDVGPVRRW